MKRRSFLKNTVATGAALSAGVGTPAMSHGNKTTGKMDDFSLNEITITELADAFAKGTMTAEQVTKKYLERIRAIDAGGPALNSVIELNPDAVEIAKKLDEERRQGKVRGPLHGIPVMLKDNINTAGNMMTTAGSLAFEGHYATENAWVAAKLEAAGAVIIGKTNLSEWANFRSTRSSSGWSGGGGQTRNPYVLDRNPCGSSSGSGVAVAANLCAAAIGTETNGSIVCPSGINGIVGVKPTVGLVSRHGIIPISHTQDTAGPMARTVADAAAILGALSGVDDRDKVTKGSEGHFHENYTIFLDRDALKGKRIGVARHFMGFHEKIDALMEQAVNDMQQLGAVPVQLEKDVFDDKIGKEAFDVLLYEFKHDLNEYLSTCPPSVKHRTLEDLIRFNKENADREMPWFGQEIFHMAQKTTGLDDPVYKNALKTMLTAVRQNGIDKVLAVHDLDAIIAPTNGPAWPIDVVTGDHFLGGSSSPAARAGYAAVTVPMGFVHGLPAGITFFAGAWSEPQLIGMAYAYEQATNHRKPPQFIQTIDFSKKP